MYGIHIVKSNTRYFYTGDGGVGEGGAVEISFHQ